MTYDAETLRISDEQGPMAAAAHLYNERHREPTPFSGFEAMGHPIPEARLTAGYKACKAMGLATDEAMTLVGRVARQLEDDQPYRAMIEATGAPFDRPASSGTASYMPGDHPKLDVTGGYRLFACLLAGEA